MTTERVDRLRLTTRGYELSSRGGLPVSQYLKYLEHVRWRMMTGDGLPLRQFWSLGVVRSQVLELEEQLGFGTEIELTMWMSRLGRTSFDLSHDIIRCEDGVVVGRSTATL